MPPSIATGIGWLLADMTLVTLMQVLVKLQGVTTPAIQLVFLRALVGLATITPLLWLKRREVMGMRHPRRNLLRVTSNAVALSLSFVALTHLPIAMANAIGFSRPLVTMGLAGLMLGERVVRGRWLAGLVALVAALLIAFPAPANGGQITALGLAAAMGATLFGALAVVQTRALADESASVMMLFYTVGLAVLTAIPAALAWVPVAGRDWPVLILIGVLAQAGQYCFLRAYRAHEASRLAPVSYASIFFSAGAGWIAFGDRPGIAFPLGVALMLAAIWMLRRERG